MHVTHTVSTVYNLHPSRSSLNKKTGACALE